MIFESALFPGVLLLLCLRLASEKHCLFFASAFTLFSYHSLATVDSVLVCNFDRPNFKTALPYYCINAGTSSIDSLEHGVPEQKFWSVTSGLDRVRIRPDEAFQDKAFSGPQ